MDKKKILSSIPKTLTMYCAVSLLAYAIMGFFALITFNVKQLNPISQAIENFSFTDIYYQILSSDSTDNVSHAITIVDMTQLYRRGQLAKVMEDIEACKPKALGVDVVFDVEKEDFEGNDSLINVAMEYDNIIFSVKYMDYDEVEGQYTREIHSFFAQYVDSLKEGFCNTVRGSAYDSMKRTLTRRTASMGEVKPSLPAHILSVYADREMWSEGDEDVNINYAPMDFVVLQPDEVLQHPELIEDRIVLLGAMDDAADAHWTPVGKIAGVKVIAYGIQTLLEKKEITSPPFLLLCIISFFITLSICYLQDRFKHSTGNSKNLFVKFIIGSSYVSGILTFLFTSIILGLSFFIFAFTNMSINLAWALSSLAFLGTSRSMYQAIIDYIENKHLQNSSK